MKTNEFEVGARQFVLETLREVHGAAPDNAAVERATAELVKNFRPVLAELRKRPTTR